MTLLKLTPFFRFHTTFIVLMLLLSSIVIHGQDNIVVTGKVSSSESNTPLEGASVIIKGATVGTTTNAEGVFQINVPDKNTILVFTYQGHSPQEITIGGNRNFLIALRQNESKLDEVIVIGYGQQKKRDVTGAISSVQAKALREVPVNSPSQMLQGRVAGLYAVTQGYKPGSDVTIRIRGSRSFSAGNDPLYVVDGIPLTGGINDINPIDIESMEVLKDASATAIYGSRGANGVIIITTKRGKTGVPTVTYDAYVGVVKALSQVELLGSAEAFAEYKRESRRASGKYRDSNKDSSDKAIFQAIELESIAMGRYTDYQDLLLQNGLQHNHQLGVYGGNDITKYGISFGYFNDKGIISTQDFTRYTMRINLDQQIGKRIKVGTSIQGTYSIRNGANLNPFDDALAENPLGVPYDSSGNLIFLPTNDGLRSNPLAELVPGAQVDKNKRFRLFSSLYGEVEIAKGLKYRLNFGPDMIQNRNGRFIGRLTNDRRQGDPKAGTSEDFVLSYALENILTYNKTFKKVHALNFTGLYSVQTRELERTATGVSGVPVENMEFQNLGAAPIVDSVRSAFEKWTILSYMARLNYVFDGRYLLTLTGRADGSSRFAPGNKWGFFPSIAVAWNISNENFFNGRLISNLKLRASYGETGNTGIEPYQTLGGLSRTTYAFDNNPAYGYRPASIPNPDLKWETTASLNIGLDFGLFNNRIAGSVEVYRQNTADLLLQRQLPITGGYGSILQNIGSTRNSGYEVTLSTVNIENSGRKNGFTWSTDLNFFQNKEEIVDLYGDKKSDIGNRWFIGQPLSVIYDYEKIGIWQTNDKDLATTYSRKPGQIRLKDQNSDGKFNADDRVILGSAVPKFTGGITNRFSFKGFDLAIFAFARFGSKITSSLHEGAQVHLQGRYNLLKVDYWTETNPTNKYPRPNENSEGPQDGSTLRYFDGSFVKIRNINLGYTFPDQLVQQIKLKGLRLYASAQQPFIFAPYRQKEKGIDPEYPTADTPATAMYSFGINAKF